MKKKTRIAAIIIAVAAAIVLTFQITYDYLGTRYQKKIEELTKNENEFAKLSVVDNLVRENYLGDISEIQISDNSSKGYVQGLGDKYSRYLSSEEYSEYKISKSTSGVGIGVRVAYNPENTEAKIYSVFPDSPAHISGIQKGDVILSVDGTSVSEIGASEAVKLLQGTNETSVHLVISRIVGSMARDLEFTVGRKEIKNWDLDFDIVSEGIGLVQIFSFSENTFEQYQYAMGKLKEKEITSLIIDLRNNAGGNIDSAVKILDSIVPEGNMYITTDHEGKIENHMSDNDFLDLPICVLCNAQTASASELLVAGLRDFKKATIIGEKTFGKGLIQTIFELDDGSAVILTTKSFAPPVSDSFNQVGIKPDVITPLYSTQNIYFTDHSLDNQLQKAIETMSN